jgi:hypothetical protein
MALPEYVQDVLRLDDIDLICPCTDSVAHSDNDDYLVSRLEMLAEIHSHAV